MGYSQVFFTNVLYYWVALIFSFWKRNDGCR